MRGILFVLKTGMQWNMLPSDAFGVSGVACWRRMREWAKEGVFARIWQITSRPFWVQAMDWEHALVDAAMTCALRLRSREDGRLDEPAQVAELALSKDQRSVTERLGALVSKYSESLKKKPARRRVVREE